MSRRNRDKEGAGRMKRIFRGGAAVFLLLIFLQSCIIEANSVNSSGGYPPDEGYEAIELKPLRAHLNFLASNRLEGREATTRGYEIAAGYAASLFQEYGLTPLVENGSERSERSFQQTFPVLEILGNSSNETLQLITMRGESQ